MARIRIDTSLERTVRGDFTFPLGVAPAEEFEPKSGYTVEFEPADGADTEGEWEEWPDRYVFDAVITAPRVERLFRAMAALLPGRIYPILDVLGHDAYREIDPYIAYDLVGLDRFLDEVRRYKDWLFEDGLVGFGAMSLEPFIYIFVDEHKIVTVRAETSLRERVEKTLAAFDLAAVEEIPTVDTVVHEHRSVLEAPPDRPDLLTAEEVVERLLDAWRLRLNVDREHNLDDNGDDLGMTAWRCLVRVEPAPDDEEGEEEEGEAAGEGGEAVGASAAAAAEVGPRYAEVLLTAANLDEAERLAFDAASEGVEGAGKAMVDDRPAVRAVAASAEGEEVEEEDGAGLDDFEEYPSLVLVAADRVLPEEYAELLAASGENGRKGASSAAPPPPPPPPPPEAPSFERAQVHSVRWHG